MGIPSLPIAIASTEKTVTLSLPSHALTVLYRCDRGEWKFSLFSSLIISELANYSQSQELFRNICIYPLICSC
ncbi:MAG: hypothetical protein N4J56_004866 [Chroococcidiopsis sp. SAG 2025]|nr:hypothetical protein [Chroococcidiopsis sp. SAG 2025]